MPSVMDQLDERGAFLATLEIATIEMLSTGTTSYLDPEVPTDHRFGGTAWGAAESGLPRRSHAPARGPRRIPRLVVADGTAAHRARDGPPRPMAWSSRRSHLHMGGAERAQCRHPGLRPRHRRSRPAIGGIGIAFHCAEVPELARRHDGAVGVGVRSRSRTWPASSGNGASSHTASSSSRTKLRARGAAGQCDRPLPLVEREAGSRHRAAAGDARRWHHRRAGHRWRLEQRHVRPVRRDQARGVRSIAPPGAIPLRRVPLESSGWPWPTALERCDRHPAASNPAELPTSCSSMQRSSASPPRPTRSIRSSSGRRRPPCAMSSSAGDWLLRDGVAVGVDLARLTHEAGDAARTAIEAAGLAAEVLTAGTTHNDLTLGRRTNPSRPDPTSPRRRPPAAKGPLNSVGADIRAPGSLKDIADGRVQLLGLAVRLRSVRAQRLAPFADLGEDRSWSTRRERRPSTTRRPLTYPRTASLGRQYASWYSGSLSGVNASSSRSSRTMSLHAWLRPPTPGFEVRRPCPPQSGHAPRIIRAIHASIGSADLWSIAASFSDSTCRGVVVLVPSVPSAASTPASTYAGIGARPSPSFRLACGR